jgi:hypothetical protein
MISTRRRGERGPRGLQGERGFSAKTGDISSWLIWVLKLLVPAYLILALSVIVAFYIGFQYANEERTRICDAVSEVTRTQVEGLIAASNSQPQEPRTQAQEDRRNAAIKQYRDSVEDGLRLCYD